MPSIRPFGATTPPEHKPTTVTAIVNRREEAMNAYRLAAIDLHEAWEDWTAAEHGFRADARRAYQAAEDREASALAELLSIHAR